MPLYVDLQKAVIEHDEEKTHVLLNELPKINGIEFKEDVNLCTASDIQTFTNEVQKIGVIVNKTVTPGVTYPA